MAVNCCVVPLAIAALPGDTAMETRAGSVTIKFTGLLVTLPETALIVVAPFSSDWVSPVAPMEATAAVEELHVTVLVRFRVVLSV